MNSSSTPYFPLFNKENWKEMQNRSREIEKIKAPSESPPQNGTEIPATSAHRKENEKIRTRRNYSCGPDADNMKKALDYIVENPESSRIEVAKKFNIDRKALSERLDGDRNVEARVGPRGYLSALEEHKLAQHLVDMASLGFGYDVYQAKVLVQAILNKDDTEITSSWFDGFMKRHPELSRRKAQAFSKNRMAASAIESVEEYFKLLEMAFNKCKAFSNGSELTSNRVYAADEIGFDSHINQGSIITKRGEKHPFIINANNSTHITLMAFASANGWAGTDFFYFQDKDRNISLILN